jgi:DNA adenine methylase
VSIQLLRAGKIAQSYGALSNALPRLYPFIKWAGGKTQLLSKIEQFMPRSFNRYFEPFLGGGAVYFHIANKKIHSKAYLSDINEELINAFVVVKSKVKELIEVLTIYETDYKKKSAREFYYHLRDNDSYPDQVGDVNRAARFIALNKTCYNGLYRVNKQGKFNVPVGRYKNPRICDRDNLLNISIALQRSCAQLILGDYRRILLDNARGGDFIYLDPPYSPVSITASFTGYTNSGFTDKDQSDLANLFKKLSRRKCLLLLSNSDTTFVKELYSDFDMHTKQVDALRSINSDGSNRMGHKELLIRNYPIQWS